MTAAVFVGVLVAAAVLASGRGVAGPRRVQALVPGWPGSNPKPLPPSASGAAWVRPWFRRLRAPGRGRLLAQRGQAELAQVERLALLLRAGLPAERAWTATFGADAQDEAPAGTTPVWSECGENPTSPELLVVWAVAKRTGASPVATLEGYARTLRSRQEASRATELAVAGPRASARVMSSLPVLGLCLGALLGAGPIAVLIYTAPGRACLVLGLVLAAAGRWWTARMVAAAGRAGP